jgi:hypothetical protein
VDPYIRTIIDATHRCSNTSSAFMRTAEPVIKRLPEQNRLANPARLVSLGITGAVSIGVPRKGSPVRKYTSTSAVNSTRSPLTRKQCCRGLHISIKKWSKCSWARSSGHSKNFSSPLAAKDAPPPHIHDLTPRCLQTNKRPILA